MHKVDGIIQLISIFVFHFLSLLFLNIRHFNRTAFEEKGEMQNKPRRKFTTKYWEINALFINFCCYELLSVLITILFFKSKLWPTSLRWTTSAPSVLFRKRSFSCSSLEIVVWIYFFIPTKSSMEQGNENCII